MLELGVAEDRVLALGLPLVRRADVERLAAADAAAGGVGVDVGGADDTGRAEAGGADRAEAGRTATEDAAGRHELSRVQRAVARAVTLSHRTVPAAYTVMRFDVGPALERARGLTREVRRPVGLPELFVRAVAGLHGRFPLLFASVGEEAGARPAARPGRWSGCPTPRASGSPSTWARACTCRSSARPAPCATSPPR
nr:hypothetical protein GCM10020093_104350 [Planobispora longispora]